MPSFKLVRADELAEFADVIRKHGWHEEEFTIEEQAYDPATAEVESESGEVIITCARTHHVGVYHLGRGSSWVTDFMDDLKVGKFGSPSTT